MKRILLHCRFTESANRFICQWLLRGGSQQLGCRTVRNITAFQ